MLMKYLRCLVYFFFLIQGVTHAVMIQVTNVQPRDWVVLVANTDYFFSINSERYIVSPEEPDNLSLNIPDGDYLFEFLKDGQTIELPVSVNQDARLKVGLKFPEKTQAAEAVKSKRLSEVRVEDKGSLSLSGNSRLTAEQARLIPGAGGDILRSLFTLPGVLTSSSFGRDLIIRGGGGDDVLYQYDDFRIGNPFHFIPPFSAFPNEIVDVLNFYPGGFNSRYFGAQGAVVDLSGAPFQPPERWHGGFSAQTENAYLWTTIPIKQKARLSITTRRSYAEFIFKILAKTLGGFLEDFDTIPFFTDVNTRLDVNLAQGHDLLFVGVYSQDGLNLITEQLETENEDGEAEEVNFEVGLKEEWWTAGAKYTWDMGYFKQAYVFSYFQRRDNLSFFGGASDEEKPTVIDLKWRGDLELTDDLYIEMGVGYFLERFPFKRRQFTTNDLLLLADNDISEKEFIERFENANNNALELNDKTVRHNFNLYTGVRWDLGKVELDAGGQLSFNTISKKLDADVRLKSVYQISPRYDLFGYVGKYSQRPKLDQVNPKLDTPSLKSPYTWQFGLGTEMKFPEVTLKAEGYYKFFLNQTLANPTFDEGYSPSEENNPRYVDIGEGRAYGMELTISRPFTKRFFGWLTYSLLYSERFTFSESVDIRDILKDTKNNGNDYKHLPRDFIPFVDDIKHGFTTVLGFFAKPNRFYMGTTFRLFSGKPHTPQVLEDDGAGGLIITTSDDILSERLPLRYYWDIQFRWIWNPKGKKTGREYQVSLFFDIPNIQTYWQQQNILDWNYPGEILIPSHPSYRLGLAAGDYPNDARDPQLEFPAFFRLGLDFNF